MSAIIKAIVAALAEAFINFMWSKKNEIVNLKDDTETDWDDLEEATFNDDDYVSYIK